MRKDAGEFATRADLTANPGVPEGGSAKAADRTETAMREPEDPPDREPNSSADADADSPVVRTLTALCERVDSHRVLDLVRLFVEDSTTRIQELQDAISRLDLPAVRRMTHDLKGSCGQLGAQSMWELCADIETSATENHPELVRSQMAVLETEFERVRAVLDRWAAGIQV